MKRPVFISWFNSPERIVFSVVALMMLGITVTVFHPGMQTRVLRDQMSERVDTFTINRVHVLPWSLTLTELEMSHAGLQLELTEAQIRFSPWKLFFDVVQLNRVAVAGLTIDLRNLPPAEDEPEPVPSLFKLIDQGIGLRLSDVDVTGQVLIDNVTSTDFEITGGEIAPNAEGTLDINAMFRRVPDEARIDLAGAVTIVQGDAGTFVALESNLDVRAGSAQVTREEQLSIVAHVEPVEKDIIDETDGETVGTVTVGDRFRVTIAKHDTGDDLFWLSANGTFDPSDQVVRGDYERKINDRLITFYAPQAVMPRFADRATGSFKIDLASTTTELDYSGVMQITDLERVLGTNTELPPRVDLLTKLSATLTPEQLELHELDAQLTNDNEDPLIGLTLDESISLPLDSPEKLLVDERKLAKLAFTNIPVTWLNGMLPEPAVRDGLLNGQFDIVTGDGEIALLPTADFGVEAAVFDEKFAVPDPLRIRMMPSLSYRTEAARLGLQHFVVQLGERELATVDVNAVVGLEGEAAPAPDVRVAATLDLNGIAGLPILAERLAGYALPENLSAALNADVNLNAERIRVKQLDASVRQHEAPPLLSVSALQAFTVALAGEPPEFRNPEGELALVSINDIDLAWLDPLVEQVNFAGKLEGGTFALSAGADGLLSLRTRDPLVLRKLDVGIESERYVDALTISLRPEVDYTPARLELRYTDLDASIGRQNLLAAAGALSVPLGDDESPPRISADGHFEVNIGQLKHLPVVSKQLAQLPAKRRWQLKVDYDLDGNDTRIDFAKLLAAISIDGETRLRFENQSALILRPQIGADEDLAQHLTGALSANVTNLSSALLGDLLPLGAISFDALAAKVTLRSDGRALTADGSEALRLTGVRLGTTDGPILEPFSIEVSGGLEALGQTIDAKLDTVSMTFDAYPDRAAIAGALSFTLEPAQTIPLRRMDANLTGVLPPMLAQPVMMPGHRLRQGGFRLDASVREDGAIKSVAVLDGLEASEPLAISNMRAESTGTMAPDGRGFKFTMPILGSGRTGDSDGLLVANYDPSDSDKARLNLDFTSKRLLLNDVLATLKSISAVQAAKTKAVKTKDKGSAAATPPNIVPDDNAFWDVLPYDTRISYRIDDLYYTDYVIFNDVAGEIDLTSDRFTLATLAARFHDSPMRFDGVIDFIEGSPSPYDLKFDGTVSEFNLNQFFSELVPGSKPRVEGLFGIAVNGHGSSPNMGQFRNELLFDMKLKSREGLFRPLPPDSTLMAGASDVLGIVGEGLSYLPTGGFGAGAVSRLVNYISVIDYDRIDIHVVRDDTRDIVIRQFLVQSPTISLTAEGGIDYADGKDILDSPLALDARLNMSGKGAAILYSMDLLEDEQDAFGYYRGPAFRIRGTPAAAESNFAEVVTAAADGTVKGGVTRPISGLIGNIKHRWFGDETITFEDEGDEQRTVPEAPTEPDTQAPESTLPQD